jgi:hypothetical protein
MSRFREELRVIPVVAWLIAIVVAVCMEFLLLRFAFADDANVRNWPFLAQAGLSTFTALIVAAYILLVGYIGRDARRRGMRPVLWTLIAIFVPNAIGIILYFFMREPVMSTCPRCGTPVKPTFAFCHQCGTEIARACPHCRRPVEHNWKACAYCGTDLVARPSGGVAPVNAAPNPGPLA